MKLEELLTNLRKEKNWSVIDVVEELSKMKIMVNEKDIRKWEVGLEYPDTDTIYKLSEIYLIPVEEFFVAKGNSYQEGFEAIHKTFIKWFCYITGLSLKIGYIGFYTFLYGALIFAFLYFVEQCNLFISIHQ